MIFKVCLFVICNSFHSLHFTFWSLGVYGEWKNLSNTNWQTSHLLQTFNSSILLITMGIFSKKYREMIFSLHCSQTKKVDGNRLAISEKCIISRSPPVTGFNNQFRNRESEFSAIIKLIYSEKAKNFENISKFYYVF